MSVQTTERPAAAGPAADLVLERFAPYRIVALGHAISGGLAGAYRSEDLTIPEWRVLAVVAQARETAARDVVRRTPMDKMTVSRAVAALDRKGFISRDLGTEDRRVTALSLTETGRALFDRIAALALDFEAALLGALTPGEREAFDRILAKLEAHCANED